MTLDVDRSPPSKRLSKFRYIAGLRCPKLLWWKVHEPDAPELAPEDGLQTILARGNRVGEVARTHVPGGVLIDLPHYEVAQRVAATAKALADGAPAVYEASFLADDVFVSVDILERRKRGFVLTEVKSTLDLKDEHLTDVAVQVHVARRAGLPVERAEVMHLNRECRAPRLTNLFVREAVTRKIASRVRAVPARAASLMATLAGPLPEVPTGAHCDAPHPCPFKERCWPARPEHHVSTLYGIRKKKVAALVAEGIETLHQVSRGFAASGPAKRQLKSVRTGRVVVERGLGRALRALKRPLAFLDFETVSPAVPVWPGCAPAQAVPVQFSCHVMVDGGEMRHHGWLADGASDPREAVARELVAACKGAATIVTYNVSFERRCVDALAAAVPGLARELGEISRRLVDLLPIVRDHVYHPTFGGSFSIKSVLPALVAGGGYGDLEIRDGAAAMGVLEEVLLAGGGMVAERDTFRRQLLQYCERDTEAMAQLYEALGELASRKSS